mgnify:CR=1 FL=1
MPYTRAREDKGEILSRLCEVSILSLKPKCTIYLRVSSKEQTVENQLPQLLQLAQSRGYEVVEVYQENESAWHAGQAEGRQG